MRCRKVKMRIFLISTYSNSKIFLYLQITISFAVLLLLNKSTEAYVNIEQYCKAFDDNFRPIICILKNNNGSTQVVHHIVKPVHRPARPRPPRPPPPPPPGSHHQVLYPILYPDPDYEVPPPPDFDVDDDDCSCDLTCYPVIANQNGTATGVTYRCRSCGSSCNVATVAKPKCSCAVPSGNATCTCTATCASFRHYTNYHDDSPEVDSAEDNSNCIFNVGSLVDMRLGEEQMPYTCECCKSKAAENNAEPDFVCICQRVSVRSGENARQVDINVDLADL